MKDHYKSSRTSGLLNGGPAARPTPIVKVGHPALDAALATERACAPSLTELRNACRLDAEVAPRPQGEVPAVSAGRPADAMALTLDREGRGPTLHVATTHRVVDVRRRARTITVWHELATFSSN